MKGHKYLIKNIGMLTLSSLGTKILGFFLIPLYTSILTAEEYGTYELIYATIGLIIPILTLNIMEGVFRFALDEDADYTVVFTTGIKYFLRGLVILLLFMAANYYIKFLPILNDYAIYVIFMYVINSLSGIVISMSRGLDKVAAISISGVLSSVVMISGNIYFLLVVEMGIRGYFLAYILSVSIQCFYLFISAKMWRYIRNSPYQKNTYKRLQEDMLAYSKPMIASSIAWWINNVSDRYIVTWLCGVAENGIYSVGYKIPNILNIFQSIFNQAWTLSAVKEFDSKDSNGFFSNLYAMYNCMLVLICSFLIGIDRILAFILYSKDFYVAWRYVPFLVIAIVFGSLSGYIGGIFSAARKSKMFAKSTLVGAACNIVLNFLLVGFIGALGAAFATAIAYCVVWILRFKDMKKYIDLKVCLGRDVVSYVVLLVQAVVVLYMEENAGMYGIQAGLFIFLLVLYRRDIIRGKRAWKNRDDS